MAAIPENKAGFYRSTLFLLMMALAVSCSNNILFEENKRLDPSGWYAEDILTFAPEIRDTVNLFDIFINVRNTNEFPYSNFYVFFQSRFPDGRLYRDTLEMTLADKQGKWTGKGLGGLKANSFHFRRDVWFPIEGVYEFTIEHAMRDNPIRGINDMGIRIEKK